MDEAHDFPAMRAALCAQLAERGIRDARVLKAMGEVPRERFVPPELQAHAYDDAPLPIAQGQTISQPYVVALMIEAMQLQPHERVLEVGAGSGYAAAVLSRVALKVFALERHESLARDATERLRLLEYDNVQVAYGDGTRGWAEHAPYDAIVAAAGGPEVPQVFMDELALGGRLVMPVGPTQFEQELLRVRRAEDGTWHRDPLGAVRFVPLIGVAGWAEGVAG